MGKYKTVNPNVSRRACDMGWEFKKDQPGVLSRDLWFTAKPVNVTLEIKSCETIDSNV